jgi:hypothetical protein
VVTAQADLEWQDLMVERDDIQDKRGDKDYLYAKK